MPQDDRLDTRTDYYRILGVPMNATFKEIQAVYWQHLRQIPPDAADGESRRRVLLEAYTVLSDPELKSRYDAGRSELQATPSRPPLPTGAARPGPAAPGPAGDGNVTTYGPVDEKDITAVEKLVARQPNNPDLLGWLAFLYYSSGQVDKAMESFQRVLALNGKDAKSHYYLGHCYVRKGQRDKAFLEWETVIALDPFGSLGRRALKRVKTLRELKR